MEKYRKMVDKMVEDGLYFLMPLVMIMTWAMIAFLVYSLVINIL